MGWKFWAREKSEAEVSLERLQGGEAVAPPATSSGAGSSGAAPSTEELAAFRMEVEDVFSITGRGTVVTGQVAAGAVRVHQDVTLRRPDGSTRALRVTGVEAFRQMLDCASTGQNVGLLLRGIARDEIAHGDVLTG